MVQSDYAAELWAYRTPSKRSGAAERRTSRSEGRYLHARGALGPEPVGSLLRAVPSLDGLIGLDPWPWSSQGL